MKISSISPISALVEYGATSLDIFRIAHFLDSELQVRVEFGQLFRLSTIEAIAEYCQRQQQI